MIHDSLTCTNYMLVVELHKYSYFCLENMMVIISKNKFVFIFLNVQKAPKFDIDKDKY